MTKKWIIKPPSPLAEQLASNLQITPIQAQLLINRGLADETSIRSFLSPRLGDMVDPFLLSGMEEATQLILTAIAAQDPITIYGDYDADGLTGAALLYQFLKHLGLPVHIYVPNRLREGYGLNREAIERLARECRGLLITVDCGVSNMQEVALAKKLGISVVVTDHHRIPRDIRFICPVVNPHRSDSSYPDRDLAGVGVAFLLAVALRARLREIGWFKNRREPELKYLLDLVAVGTVADQVPLLGQNRIFVHHGLERLKHTRWEGLKAIMEVSSIKSNAIDTWDIAFRIAPRLNAPGRLSSPEVCIQVLTEKDGSAAKKLALRLNEANNERQRLEQSILAEVCEAMEQDDSFYRAKVLIAGKEGWHEGVLGIVASKLVDLYYRPTLLFALDGDMAKGSGRSIDQFNLYEAISQAGHLFDRFGGHAHAAGFSLKRERLDAVKETLASIAEEILDEEALTPSLEVDAELSFCAISRKLIEDFDALAPFGKGNPEPTFCTRGVQVLDARVVGDKHLKMRLKNDGKVYEAIGFGMGQALPSVGRLMDIIFTPELNSWQGYDTIQLRVLDFRESRDFTSNP
ncbi:MAG: single-stranded-DNA-specific exonuclease RecJ [Deltaproteobacteria bacterium]|nr:MAG: single-stranded-DNA-specific exonuclease RecJ [Deltaproteobacteria bacterium]